MSPRRKEPLTTINADCFAFQRCPRVIYMQDDTAAMEAAEFISYASQLPRT